MQIRANTFLLRRKGTNGLAERDSSQTERRGEGENLESFEKDKREIRWGRFLIGYNLNVII